MGPCTLKHCDEAAEATDDGVYLKLNDNAYMFCYRDTSSELRDVRLPSPKFVSIDEIWPTPSWCSSFSQSSSNAIKLPKAVFDVLTLKGRKAVVCDDPELLRVAEQIQQRMISSTDNHTDGERVGVEPLALTLPTLSHTNLLMLPLRLSPEQERVYRKDQFITMIKSCLAKHGIQPWTDMRLFRPNPVINTDTVGKYHSFHKSKLDLFFKPKSQLSSRITFTCSARVHRCIGSGVLICNVLCSTSGHHDGVESATTLRDNPNIQGDSAQSPNRYDLLDIAMKEALIIGAEMVSYSLTTHNDSIALLMKNMVVEVYLLIMSMVVDEAQILHMELDLRKTGEHKPVFKLTSTESRCAVFNKLMNYLIVPV